MGHTSLAANMTLKGALGSYLTDVRGGCVRSLAPLLPLFSMKGRPMHLRKHFQFAPMFNLDVPEVDVWQCARQVGKSVSISAKAYLLSAVLPDFNVLMMQPRFDQVQRFNRQVLRPLLRSFLLRREVMDAEEERSFLIRSFRNNSSLLLDYAFLSAERIRGHTNISSLFLDESQDIMAEFIPLIEETMSASELYGFTTYTGTPKTTDGPLSDKYDNSSQGEWTTKCTHCNKYNIASPSQDLFRMIGNGAETSHGLHSCVCAKCGLPLDVRTGCYLHAFPERSWSVCGRHVSQVTHPIHCTSPRKWRKLLGKMHDYGKVKFFNEVLGVPCDESIKLLTYNDLKKVSNRIPRDYRKALEMREQYSRVLLSADWSGGGNLTKSFTAVAVVGMRDSSPKADCLYAERFPSSMQPSDETHRVLRYFADFRATAFAHDYTGAGYLRELLLVQAGMPKDRIVPFSYLVSPKNSIVSYERTEGSARSSYTLDKPRSLVVLVEMIKNGMVTLPELDGTAADVLLDLLARVEDPRELARGNILYLITRQASRSDDFAHALNFACSALWTMRGEYPTVGAAEKYRVHEPVMAEVDPLMASQYIRDGSMKPPEAEKEEDDD